MSIETEEELERHINYLQGRLTQEVRQRSTLILLRATIDHIADLARIGLASKRLAEEYGKRPRLPPPTEPPPPPPQRGVR